MIDRVRRLAVALRALGVRSGDRVATLQWNSQAHLEAYLAMPAIGAVLHTLNLRLHADDLSYIVNDAADRVLIVDESLLPIYDKFRDRVKIEHVIVVSSGGVCERAAGPAETAYETLLAAADPQEYVEPDLDENHAAAMCYTSGTTGRPKGVLYSHRAIILHSFGQGLVDTLGISECDTVLPIVPMFHVNAWGLPFTCTLFGSGQVFAGPASRPQERPRTAPHRAGDLDRRCADGVPRPAPGTRSRSRAYDLSALRAIVIGGSAAPPSMIRGFKERHGLDIVHAWGMTEMTPLGTLCNLPAALREAPAEEQFRYRARQGTPLPFVELRAATEDGFAEWDGKTMGELQVRGPWVARQYFNFDGPDDRFTDDGWFRTGDIVTIDASGCIELTDRAKDLVKSGGEWISSVALETALMGHPCVAEAAVVAVPHPKWDERPLAVVVLKAGHNATPEELIEFLSARVRQVVAARRHRIRDGNSQNLRRQVQEVSFAGQIQG